MAEQIRNPFEDEQPKIVHLEKDESHYEVCRMQMHEINRIHKRTFFCNMALCIVVCFLAMFQQTIAGFDILSTPFTVSDKPGMILAVGIFQIIVAMVVILCGYLAWANFHTLNIFLTIWYGFVTAIGIYRLDFFSSIIGAVGVVFYFFSLRAMQRENTLSEMEGYPEFQEKFDISKSDIVIQTLLAHQGEHRTKSTLFTTDYSLRKKKKKPGYYKNGSSFRENADSEKADAGAELAQILQKQISEVKDAKETRTAIAALDADAAARKREKDGVSLKDIAEFEKLPASAAAEPAETAEPVPAAPAAGLTDAAEDAAAKILADAEAKARAILAEAEAKAKAMSAEPAADAAPAQPADAKPAEKPAEKNGQPAQRGSGTPQNRRRKKK